MSSAELLSASNFQIAPIYFKFGKYVVLMSNGLAPDETPGYSTTHLDPSYLHLASRFALSMIRVKNCQYIRRFCLDRCIEVQMA